MTTTTTSIERDRMGGLVLNFLRLGCLGFGGPVARELVDGKKWPTKGRTLEAIAIRRSVGLIAYPVLQPTSVTVH